ncbi:MAG: response regulator [Nitrososphaeraceae archaeon]|jgi:DNA-binding NtrC family response regulator|nr:response regulator [Nitrososphaeraceae archaeon]MDW0170022.1 response regulator [Nitrososphaeraceae archaeon]MDW0170782.1 response regulator [Nitrososphaeraceae archaeon]MDW0174588.1 response regulator [Nitrososphaeraceae archaeon]MDW0176829.1 response regulator [Nitrososphaeraceae archaeon]
MEKSPEKLKIMIVQGDEDNMTLYSDFLSRRGYHVIARYTKGDDILTDVEKEPPDVFVLNSRLPGNKSGTEVATEILDVYPSAPILFITADYGQPVQVKKHPKLRDKKVEILIKPVKLEQVENTILNLVNK